MSFTEWVELCLPKRHIYVLIPGTCLCDLIWKIKLKKGHTGLGWALYPISIRERREKFDHIARKKVM